MKVRRLAGGLVALAAAATTAGILASPAQAATPTTITLDLAGMTSPACPAQLPLENTIALANGTSVVFAKGVLSTVATLASAEKVTVTQLDASGKPVKTVVDSQSVPLAAPLTLNANTSYKLDWKALNLLGIVQGTQTGTLIMSDNANSQCGLAVSVPTPGVSVPGLAPVNSAVNSLVGGAIGAVNSAVAPVNSVVNKATSAAALIPGLGGAKVPGATSSAPASGFSYSPWSCGPACSVVPTGYGAGPGAAYTYVPPAANQSYNLQDTLGAASSGAANGNSAGNPVPTTTQTGPVDLAASKNRGLLDSLSGVFVVLSFAALSGAVAYYVRNFLRANGGKFI